MVYIQAWGILLSQKENSEILVTDISLQLTYLKPRSDFSFSDRIGWVTNLSSVTEERPYNSSRDLYHQERYLPFVGMVAHCMQSRRA